MFDIFKQCVYCGEGSKCEEEGGYNMVKKTPKKPKKEMRFQGSDFIRPDHQRALQALTMAFECKMCIRLIKKLDDGFIGWDEPSEFENDRIVHQMTLNVEALKFNLQPPFRSKKEQSEIIRKTCIDIANFAAFLWNRYPEEGK